MYRLLDKGLEQLTTMVYKMGEVAEKALTTSIGSFASGKDTSKDVFELSEILVSMTVETEEKAFALIAKYQPVASDLRIINSYMRIAYDFERFGRYAWDISSICKRFGGLQDCEEWMTQFFEGMGEKVLRMVRVSIDSLKTQNTELAKTISKTEKEVDKMYFDHLDKLVQEAHATSQCTISSVLGVRYLERIADHAAYIAEAVVYIATGQKIMLR
jgi:phosphate transport system protein